MRAVLAVLAFAATAAAAGSTNPFIRLLAPAYRRIGETRLHLEAQHAGLLAAMAIAAHRAEKRELPASLRGRGVPAEPYTGKLLELRMGKESVQVWAGGKDPQGRDVVFEIRR